jgi:hypothetical protein
MGPRFYVRDLLFRRTLQGCSEGLQISEGVEKWQKEQ